MAPSEIRVWDPAVRIGHWVLVAAYVVAYLTEDASLLVHTWAGYTVAAVVAFRIAWGVVGPRHARFADFVYRWPAVRDYAIGLATFRARRYLGHSPAGGAMVVALLASLAVTTLTGMATLAQQENAGPLVPWLGRASAEAPSAPATGTIVAEARADDGDRHGVRSERRRRGAFKGVHEFFANLTLFLAILHIGGVALASFVHRENLVRAMITGRKRAEDHSG